MIRQEMVNRQYTDLANKRMEHVGERLVHEYIDLSIKIIDRGERKYTCEKIVQ